MNKLQEINLRGRHDYNLDFQGWTDKDHPQGHDYLGFYQRIFDQYLTQTPIKLLEIGVANGASMWIFKEYFKDYQFTGVDIHPTFHQSLEYQQELVNDPNIQLLWSKDSEKSETYKNLSDFDIIIDDGCHNPWTQIKTLEACYHTLKPQGIYVIEDLHDQNRALEVANKIHETYGHIPEIFFGRNYPQRSDDIIVWFRKTK